MDLMFNNALVTTDRLNPSLIVCKPLNDSLCPVVLAA